MELLVTKECINCHHSIFCYKDVDTKCQRCNHIITASTPTTNPTLPPVDSLPHRYPLPGGIRIEYNMPYSDTQQQRIKELEEINAEMLEALEMVVAWGDPTGTLKQSELPTLTAVYAAIAKAKGEE